MAQPKIDIDGPDGLFLLPFAKRQLARFKKLLSFGKRHWELPGGETVTIWWGLTRDKIRITAAIPVPWPFFTVGRHNVFGAWPNVGHEVSFPNYSGKVEELNPLAVGLVWNDEPLVELFANNGHPFNTANNLPTSMAQSLALVRGAYRAGYPELALALFKSGALGLRSLGGGLVNRPVTLIVDASLQDFYEATVTGQMHNTTGITVLEDDTILLTSQVAFSGGSITNPPVGINGNPAVPAPTKGIGATPAGDTPYFAHTSVIDLASRSVWPFAIAILKVNNEATSIFDLFDSARLVDARQALSALVNPIELGIPRSANSEQSQPLNYWTSATHDTSGGSGTVIEFVSCNSYPTRVGTNIVWYQRASDPAGSHPTFATRIAVALRPVSATAFEIVQTYTGITYLDYDTDNHPPPIFSFFTVVNNTIPFSLHSLDARLYATYQSGLADGTLVVPEQEGKITPQGAGGFSYPLTGSTDTVSFGSTLGGRLATTSISTNAGGNDTTTKLFVDDVQVHSVVGPDIEATGSMAQVSPIPIDGNNVISSGVNRPPFFVSSAQGVGAASNTRHYTWDAIPFPHGPQFELSMSSFYRVMTVLRGLLPPSHLVIRAGDDPDFEKFGWSARLSELPAFSVVATDPPAQFDHLFGFNVEFVMPPPRIYSAEGQGPSQTEFDSLDTEYAAFLALPAGTPEELVAKIASWNNLRVNAATFFGSFHEVAWSENVPAEQQDTLVKILSGTGFPDLHFRGVVGLPSQVAEFEEAFP